MEQIKPQRSKLWIPLCLGSIPLLLLYLFLAFNVELTSLHCHNSLSSGWTTIAGGSNTTDFRFSQLGDGTRTFLILSIIFMALGILMVIVTMIANIKTKLYDRLVFVLLGIFALALLFTFISGWIADGDMMNGKTAYDVNAYCGSGGCYATSRGCKTGWSGMTWLWIFSLIIGGVNMGAYAAGCPQD